MQFTALFTELARDLTAASMFGSPVVYHSKAGRPAYDPATGTVTAAETTYNITAGVEQVTRSSSDGGQEVTELKVWIAATSVPVEPKTSDTIEYGGKTWHCTAASPEFSADGKIIAWASTFRS